MSTSPAPYFFMSYSREDTVKHLPKTGGDLIRIALRRQDDARIHRPEIVVLHITIRRF